MKKTELDRKHRDLKKSLKKENKLESIKQSREDANLTVGSSITSLSALFQYDEEEIFNINHNEKILEMVLLFQETFNEKDLENIFRKAIKKTKVKEKQKAFDNLKSLMA